MRGDLTKNVSGWKWGRKFCYLSGKEQVFKCKCITHLIVVVSVGREEARESGREKVEEVTGGSLQTILHSLTLTLNNWGAIRELWPNINLQNHSRSLLKINSEKEKAGQQWRGFGNYLDMPVTTKFIKHLLLKVFNF